MATGDWWYNSDSGSVNQQSIPDWAGGSVESHLGLGWHGPFKTQQQAFDYYTNNRAKNPGWKAPTTSPAKAIVQDATGMDATSFVHNVDSYFMRIGEILLGLVLIGVGIAAITGTGNLITKAGKLAVL
jgi:hypothetical protein